MFLRAPRLVSVIKDAVDYKLLQHRNNCCLFLGIWHPSRGIKRVNWTGITPHPGSKLQIWITHFWCVVSYHLHFNSSQRMDCCHSWATAVWVVHNPLRSQSLEGIVGDTQQRSIHWSLTNYCCHNKGKTFLQYNVRLCLLFMPEMEEHQASQTAHKPPISQHFCHWVRAAFMQMTNGWSRFDLFLNNSKNIHQCKRQNHHSKANI